MHFAVPQRSMRRDPHTLRTAPPLPAAASGRMAQTMPTMPQGPRQPSGAVFQDMGDLFNFYEEALGMHLNSDVPRSPNGALVGTLGVLDSPSARKYLKMHRFWPSMTSRLAQTLDDPSLSGFGCSSDSLAACADSPTSSRPLSSAGRPPLSTCHSPSSTGRPPSSAGRPLSSAVERSPTVSRRASLVSPLPESLSPLQRQKPPKLPVSRLYTSFPGLHVSYSKSACEEPCHDDVCPEAIKPDDMPASIGPPTAPMPTPDHQNTPPGEEAESEVRRRKREKKALLRKMEKEEEDRYRKILEQRMKDRTSNLLEDMEMSEDEAEEPSGRPEQQRQRKAKFEQGSSKLIAKLRVLDQFQRRTFDDLQTAESRHQQRLESQLGALPKAPAS